MSLSAAGDMVATSAMSGGMPSASARRDGTPRRTRQREGVDMAGVSPKAKQPMPVLEVGDPGMSNGDMAIPELTQAVCQLQAQQLAHAPWMQAMTNAVGDFASTLDGASKEILAVHGAHI